jgi:hypothetical protein
MKNYGDPSSTIPYQCFMGRWEGLCKTFSPRGEFIEAAVVHMDVYWNEVGKSWHLMEDFENLYEVGKTVFHTDIFVEGKYCWAVSDQLSLEGTELTPFNYVFVIDSKVSNTLVFNNHYFLDPNTRRIITHKLQNGKTYVFQIQDFVRIQQPWRI